jgi:hypothetical protein
MVPGRVRGPGAPPERNLRPPREDIAEEPDQACRKKPAGFLLLWVVMSALWMVATLLRIHRVWVPLVGWEGALAGPWMWISLILPPVMFAAILLAIWIMANRR